MYKMILWDFDGTLANTGEDVWRAVEYAAEKCGGELKADFRRENSNLGKPLEDIFHMVNPYPGDAKFPMFDEFVCVYYRKISEYQGTYLYEGIADLICETKKNSIVNCIITIKPQEALERILRKKGWDTMFEEWFSPDSFPHCEKTKSELIAHVLEQSRCELSEYIYVGDTWSDVAAAHENQIACIGVTYGDGDTVCLKKMAPEYLADNVLEIQKILEEGAK